MQSSLHKHIYMSYMHVHVHVKSTVYRQLLHVHVAVHIDIRHTVLTQDSMVVCIGVYTVYDTVLACHHYTISS